MKIFWIRGKLFIKYLLKDDDKIIYKELKIKEIYNLTNDDIKRLNIYYLIRFWFNFINIKKRNRKKIWFCFSAKKNEIKYYYF